MWWWVGGSFEKKFSAHNSKHICPHGCGGAATRINLLAVAGKEDENLQCKPASDGKTEETTGDGPDIVDKEITQVQTPKEIKDLKSALSDNPEVDLGERLKLIEANKEANEKV